MRYVAFLRAINVRGHTSVRMADLRAAIESAGCTRVATYIQSGNVFFEAGTQAVLDRVQERVGSVSGGGGILFIRTQAELKAIMDSDPFGSLVEARRLKLYVAFLDCAPSLPGRLPVKSEKDALELIAIRGKEAFTVSRPRPGSRMYGFPNAFVEGLLGAKATSRNWNTLAKLSALLEQA